MFSISELHKTHLQLSSPSMIPLRLNCSRVASLFRSILHPKNLTVCGIFASQMTFSAYLCPVLIKETAYSCLICIQHDFMVKTPLLSQGHTALSGMSASKRTPYKKVSSFATSCSSTSWLGRNINIREIHYETNTSLT